RVSVEGWHSQGKKVQGDVESNRVTRNRLDEVDSALPVTISHSLERSSASASRYDCGVVTIAVACYDGAVVEADLNSGYRLRSIVGISNSTSDGAQFTIQR